jgi:hypothetical protein
MTAFRLVLGCGSATPQCILGLAYRIAEAARGVGLAVSSIKSSHSSGSPSRYVTLRDQRGRAWQIRVSNHRRPRINSHAAPHLDLISFDGQSGLPEASAFLCQIAAGEIPWRDIDAARVPRKRRAHLGREAF